MQFYHEPPLTQYAYFVWFCPLPPLYSAVMQWKSVSIWSQKSTLSLKRFSPRPFVYLTDIIAHFSESRSDTRHTKKNFRSQSSEGWVKHTWFCLPVPLTLYSSPRTPFSVKKESLSNNLTRWRLISVRSSALLTSSFPSFVTKTWTIIFEEWCSSVSQVRMQILPRREQPSFIAHQ